MTGTHVFLTRYNVATNPIEHRLASETWLQERTELFRRFTIPSVRAQDHPHVGWVVLVDAYSPSWFLEEVRAWQTEGLLTPLFHTGGPLDKAGLRDAVRAEVRRVGVEGHVVTSNLDNDDGLARNFASRLEALAATVPATPSALYLSRGLIRTGTATYLRHDPDNAFVAVTDDPTVEDFATCWDGWHNLLASTLPVRRDDGEPGWLQVVHGRNVSNRVRGRLVDPRPHRADFPGLLDDLDQPDRRTLLKESMLGPLRQGFDAVRGPAVRFAHARLGTHRFEVLKLRLHTRR